MAAAMSLFKNAVLSLSKSSSPVGPSLPLRPKVSRVCFTSATRHPQGRSMADEGGKSEYSPYNSDETVAEPRDDQVGETMDNVFKHKTQEMKDKAKENADNVKEKAYDAKERAKEMAGEMNEKSKESFGSIADKANEMRDKTKDTAEDMADSTKHQARDAADKTKGMAGKVADTAQSVGEKAKETVQGAWGAAKETTQKIKETVVGTSSDSDVDDYVEDHVRKPAKEKVMDEDVLDAARRRDEDTDRKKY